MWWRFRASISRLFYVRWFWSLLRSMLTFASFRLAYWILCLAVYTQLVRVLYLPRFTPLTLRYYFILLWLYFIFCIFFYSTLQVRKRGRAESSAQDETVFYQHNIDVIPRYFDREVNLEFIVLDFIHEVEIHEEFPTLDCQRHHSCKILETSSWNYISGE